MSEVKTLDKSDLRALKEADKLHFSHREGQSGITCIRTIKDKVWGEYEQEYFIWCDASLGSPDFQRTANGKPFRANHLEMFVKSTRSILSIISLVREGMTLRLIWDNNGKESTLTREKELRVDSIYIQMCKPNGDSLTLLVDTHISFDNSARMIIGADEL